MPYPRRAPTPAIANPCATSDQRTRRSSRRKAPDIPFVLGLDSGLDLLVGYLLHEAPGPAGAVHDREVGRQGVDDRRR